MKETTFAGTRRASRHRLPAEEIGNPGQSGTCPGEEKPSGFGKVNRRVRSLGARRARGSEVLLRLSFAEIAAMRGVSERTVKRAWERSRIYLHRALGGDSLVA
jgi:hypothetical protein